jgi:hypothetical protein
LTKSILAICPSCQSKGRFVWLGEQRWPEAVARKLGVPNPVGLWSCPHCHTTVSEIALIESNDKDECNEELPLSSDDSPLRSYLTC